MSSIFGKFLVELVLVSFFFYSWMEKKIISLKVHHHYKYLVTPYSVFIRNLFSFALDNSNSSFRCSLDRPKHSTVYHNRQRVLLIISQNSQFFTSLHYSTRHVFVYRVLPQQELGSSTHSPTRMFRLQPTPALSLYSCLLPHNCTLKIYYSYAFKCLPAASNYLLTQG